MVITHASETRLCVLFLDMLPHQWILSSFPSPIRLFGSALLSRIDSHRIDAEKAAEWGEPLVLLLSLPLSLSRLTPPSHIHPPCFSLHLPTLSFSLSSSPFLYTHTHTHTAICTSLALAFDNYRCAISSHVRQKGSPPIVLRVTNNAW